MKTNDTLLVSIDFSNGEDVGVMVVGRKAPGGAVEVVNAFQGKDAEDLYQQLITVKTKGD